MAMHDAIAKVNNLIAIKQKKLEEDQKRISEALAKRAKESEEKNECEDKSEKKQFYIININSMKKEDVIKARENKEDLLMEVDEHCIMC